jgi:hypothetical protein
MSANTPALPIAGFYPGTFRSGMFLYRKGRDQRAAALAKRAGGVRLNICAISGSFSLSSSGAEPGTSNFNCRFTSKPRVAARCFARVAGAARGVLD